MGVAACSQDEESCCSHQAVIKRSMRKVAAARSQDDGMDDFCDIPPLCKGGQS
jgi:hypothetical protein